MNRRSIVKWLAAAPLAGGLGTWAASWSLRPAFAKGEKAVEELQKNWKALLADGADVANSAEPLKLPDAEWKKRLPREAYDVLRKEGTERAGSSPLDREKRPGVFACAGCGLPLFTSAMKFDSGTGWPSFFTIIPGAIGTSRDFKLIYPRTEYHCARCGGHQGHLFDDGPEPTGQRYCNNGVALRFIPKTG
jgi:peptide-methionine (R)-S-oxide reductase